MPRVEPQLREYFDAGVERITVEDVIARAEVQQNRLEPLRARRNLKPAWAAVGAFAVTFVGLGGLAAVLKVTERITGEVGVGEAEIVAADGGTLGTWLVVAFVAALAAATAIWLTRRPEKKDAQDRQDQRKVMVMETIEDTGSETGATQETKAPSRWPTVVIVVLAVALVGLVAWMAFMMRPNSPNAAPPEIVRLMEDYVAAWNAHDADALEPLVTDEYRIFSDVPGFDHDMERVRSYLMPQLEDWDWQAAPVGPIYAVKTSGFWWAVSGEGGTITRGGVERGTNDLWTVFGASDGTYLVSEHYMVGG